MAGGSRCRGDGYRFGLKGVSIGRWDWNDIIITGFAIWIRDEGKRAVSTLESFLRKAVVYALQGGFHIFCGLSGKGDGRGD